MNSKEFKDRVRGIINSKRPDRPAMVDALAAELFPEERIKFDEPEKSVCHRCDGKGFILEQQATFDI